MQILIARILKPPLYPTFLFFRHLHSRSDSSFDTSWGDVRGNETGRVNITCGSRRVSTVGLYRKALAWLARGPWQLAPRAASLACGMHTIARAIRRDVVWCVVCLVPGPLSFSLSFTLTRSLRVRLARARWRWVVEAPAAAPFDLPGHAPFFHFFTP